MPIQNFKGRHRGEPIAILANGPSLVDTKIPDGMVTIGINASMSYHWSPYWVAMDIQTLHVANRNDYRPDYAFISRGLDYPKAESIGLKWQEFPEDGSIAWSDDIEEVIYICHSSVWTAAQIASYMGGDPVFVVGMDLKGPRPKGHIHAGDPMPDYAIHHQLELMGYLRGLIDCGRVQTRVYNCSLDSACKSLPFAKDWKPYRIDETLVRY